MHGVIVRICHAWGFPLSWDYREISTVMGLSKNSAHLAGPTLTLSALAAGEILGPLPRCNGSRYKLM